MYVCNSHYTETLLYGIRFKYKRELYCTAFAVNNVIMQRSQNHSSWHLGNDDNNVKNII